MSNIIKKMSKIRVEYFLYLLLLIYFIANISFLTDFPFIHSDESWLSGLSRNILESKDIASTESFFDLYPRNPHAIKIIFHSLQAIIISLFGYSIYYMRLISLFFGVITLLFYYKIINHFFNSEWLSLLATILLSIDIQFIYASHFARQEMLLVFIFSMTFYYNILHLNKLSLKHSIITGIIIGISIGIHPNSFIIAMPFLLIYTYKTIRNVPQLKLLISYIATVSSFALFFILLSLSFNPNFFMDYTSFGATLGVTTSLFDKISQLKYFFMKLYYGISGTYYTPNIKLIFIFLLIFSILSVFLKIKDNNKTFNEYISIIYLSILGIISGIVIIGRYNPTSIIFLFPLLYMLAIYVLSKIQSKYRIVLLILLICISFSISFTNISPYTKASYEDYLNEIGNVVPKDSIVLANLNLEYYFENNMLHDYRNLSYLVQSKISFTDYISINNIEYIIYPEEMDLIYNTRPLWNGLYGNLYPYYEDMHKFFKEQCTLVDTFESHYGMRIARYFLDKKWLIKIYRVNNLT